MIEIQKSQSLGKASPNLFNPSDYWMKICGGWGPGKLQNHTTIYSYRRASTGLVRATLIVW